MKFKLFILVIALACFLRFYSLDKIPPSLNVDEAYQGYNAYSLTATGKDHLGKSFPLYFRTFGTFQSPLYTYLTTIPVSLLGPTIFSTRLISALSGVLVVILTFIIIRQFKNQISKKVALISLFLVGIAPWAVFFSRNATEANLALLIFLVSLLLFSKALQKPKFLFLASLTLGISTYAYTAQNIISVIFMAAYFIIFRKAFSKKDILIALFVFFLVQIPELLLIGTKAATRRLDQVNYWSNLSGNLSKDTLFLIRKFMSQYIAFVSPKNLFFDPDPQMVRSIPDLSVFYSWMVIPFLLGIKVFFKNFKDPIIKLLALTAVVSLIPAALTTEPFYTMRVLPYLWVVTIVIAFGTYFIYQKLKKAYKFLFVFFIVALSLGLLYEKYFVLLKYERSLSYGYPYLELAKKTEEIKNRKFVVDTGRDNPYILLAFYKKYDPLKFQKLNGIKNTENYYNDIDFAINYLIGTIEERPINWNESKEYILVGDPSVFSVAEIQHHNLTLDYEIKDLAGNSALKLYTINQK